MKKSKLRAFLASPASVSRSRYHSCSVCLRPDVAADLVEFLDLKAAGETSVSYRHYYERHICQQYKPAPCTTAMRRHIIQCLGRDVVTGKKISP